MSKRLISVRIDKQTLNELENLIPNFDTLYEKADRTKVIEKLLDEGIKRTKRKAMVGAFSYSLSMLAFCYFSFFLASLM